MQAQELTAKAEALNVNPYFLGYALETGVSTPQEAFERDGGNYLFMAWNGARWNEQAKAEKVSREFVTVAKGAVERHIALIASRLH